MSVDVKIMKRARRTFYQAEWVDPVTGKMRSRSTRTTKKKEALKFAAALEVELSRSSERSLIPWAEFRERYEQRVLSKKAESTQVDVRATLNYIERFVNPRSPNVLTGTVIGEFTDELESVCNSTATIKKHLAYVRTMLRWAKRRNYISDMPDIEIPRIRATMKGRPITKEEFERMIKKTKKLRRGQSPSWIELLNGLWWSGLRLDEILHLHWDDTSCIVPDLTDHPPVFMIPPNREKNRKGGMCPMAPEFAELLQAIPDSRRSGFVFDPRRLAPPFDVRMSLTSVSRIISEIGEAAQVVVSSKEGQVKYASAHDLRRAFGSRWSLKVNETVLCQLMRHESIQTTKQFYAGDNAKAAALAAWRTKTDTFTDTSGCSAESEIVPNS